MTATAVSILMVEDNPGDVELVEEYLSDGFQQAYQVHHCQRLDQALAFLANDSCDVILLDLSLPDSRGLATFLVLHQRAQDIPVVILTGHSDDTLASQAIQNGAKDFLPKNSLDGIQLARTIRYALERRQWEETIHLGEERIRRLEKLEAVGRLSAGIAHNFNNILTAIIGNCELLLTQLGADPQARRRAEAILTASRRASSLTRELTAFCRTQPTKRQVFSLNQILDDMHLLLQGAISKDITFQLDLRADAGYIESDPAQIEQIVLNLVINARDAMPNGGPIIIRTMAVDLATAADGLPDIVPPGSYVALTIHDSGKGMDATTAQRAFEPFFTTKEEGKGTGLGLATVYSIVGQNNGYVHLVSQPGAGSTFTFYFPRHSSPVETHAPSPRNQVKKRGSETILLVEDEAEVRLLLAESLREEGYQVLTAEDGEEASALFAARDQAISLVVTDLNMPRLGGIELTRQLRQISPTLPIIHMTGYVQDTAKDGTGQEAPTALLLKPFSPQQLTTLVRDLLAIGLKPG
jgi:two-component system cell cycle sensor histidine kinase/response regulator CckA